MYKLLRFFRSMRFGIMLLCLIAILSVAGTAIPQGREIAWYAQAYRRFHGTILILRLNDVFGSWYFQLLLILLGLNLTLCSLVRIRSVYAAKAGEREALSTRLSSTAFGRRTAGQRRKGRAGSSAKTVSDATAAS